MNKIVSDDGSATLFNEQYKQSYHSIHGAVTESELVYLEYSGVHARLAQDLNTHVLEIGFGLALNFLLTARCALNTKASLHYLALENAPISKQTFDSLDYASIDGLKPFTDGTSDIFDSLKSEPVVHHEFTDGIALEVRRTNALDVVLEASRFDAIYLDAFSPEANPELWSVEFLSKLFYALKPGGRVSTYCVKGVVRRAFIEVGFDVKKMPGPPGKREVLFAYREG